VIFLACKYCRDKRCVIEQCDRMSLKGNFYPGIVMGISHNELWVSSVSDTYEPDVQETSVKINFCPMCGEKLEGAIK
jgi:hypothetical protein